MVALLTRAQFVGRVAVLTTAGVLSVAKPSSHPALCAEMAAGNVKQQSPDFAAWDSIVKAHVKPSEIRGIAVNAVDYQGLLLWFWQLELCMLATRGGVLSTFSFMGSGGTAEHNAD